MFEKCPVVNGLLGGLRAQCGSRSELSDVLNQLDALEERAVSEPPRFCTHAERRQRVALCAVYAMHTACLLVAGLGLEPPELPDGKPSMLEHTCDALLELCKLEALEFSILGGPRPGARRIHTKKLSRTTKTLEACRGLAVSVQTHLALGAHDPTEKSHARRCGSELAHVFDVGETPFEQRIQCARRFLDHSR